MLRFKRTNITYISIHTSCRRRRFIVEGTQDRRVHVCICLLSSAVDMIDAPTYTHASPPFPRTYACACEGSKFLDKQFTLSEGCVYYIRSIIYFAFFLPFFLLLLLLLYITCVCVCFLTFHRFRPIS